MKEKVIISLEVLAILKDNCVGFFLFSNLFYFFVCVSLVLMGAEHSLACIEHGS